MKSKKKILIVEDDEFFREALKEFLEESGYSVLQVDNGRSALNIITGGGLDLIISDVQMPHMDGVELLEWLQKNSKQTPLVLMTGFAHLLETQKAQDLGAADFITKPFENEQLLEIIKNIVKDKQQEEEIATKSNDHGFCKVPIKEFVTNPKITYDIYIRLSEHKFVKIGHAEMTLNIDRLRDYKAKGIDYLYIKKEDFHKVLEFNMKVNEALAKCKKVDAQKKANFMRYTGELILEQCFIGGLNKEAFHTAKNYLEQHLNNILDPEINTNLLNALNSHSNETYAHSVGVSLYSIMIARKMGLESPSTHYRLSMGGLFMDIGKKEIPDEILDKPRALLTQKERNLLESHPVRSKEILQELKHIPGEVVQIALEHHEDEIGMGYPRGIDKTRIHPLAKILAVADRFIVSMLRAKEHTQEAALRVLSEMEYYSDQMDQKAFLALRQLFGEAGEKNKNTAEEVSDGHLAS